MKQALRMRWQRLERVCARWLQRVAAAMRRIGQPAAEAQRPTPVRAPALEAPSTPTDPERMPDRPAWRSGSNDGDVVELAPPVVEPRVEAPAPPRRGEFSDGSFTLAAGTRPYKLFVPGADTGHARPLLVMLHGCRQHPVDFAAGTRMNELALVQDVVVLYPGQVQSANPLGCWNWFHEGDQQRDRGEPSLIAGMTRHIIATQHIDPSRVYIAGLSAGGAMAAVMAATYPDLYAAVGIHSGLPHAVARNLATALRAMRHGPPAQRARLSSATQAQLPLIVFHGDLDTTVHPDNGEELIARVRWSSAAQLDASRGGRMAVETGEVSGGRAFTRTLHLDAEGRCDAEHWLVHGGDHAWSGGSPTGSYTDPLGPDASAQMLRFFMAHSRR
ncbi:PHB depolymerase family esterase [Piscinibacter sp. XHJ-5]|uniref:extracellular catalytic domain type 1 short-chain-length polyhydroxyalkanoate depolymerase n=1 Tax=Piscinibacter sp. XHJ-5 TaxID=3037797 RepID=UPI002452BEED|nr:PHB depolymerase family esterase [Piscinibacter sp. XHJ-5]